MQKISLIGIFIVSFVVLPFFAAFSPAENPSAAYLCDFGISFYKDGRYDEALTEFNKALLLDPDNKIALDYINRIFKEELGAKKTAYPNETAPLARDDSVSPTQDRKSAIEDTLDQVAKSQANPLDSPDTVEEDEEEGLRVAGVKISGEAQIRLGIEAGGDVIWKRANWDLNEKNWRELSDAGFNKRENTYDPRIYDRLRVNLDTDKEEGFGFHADITADPWSVRGKSDKVTIAGTGGDAAEVQLKYWANTGYTVNDRVGTLFNGDAFNLPELKVVDGHTNPFTTTSMFGNTFNVPSMDIDYTFQPVREFWVDYKQEGMLLKVFPFAYEDQALTTDDPLKLSNNRIWWENSPWIERWLPGRLNTGATPDDFTKGYWDDSIAFSARDSEGVRLTNLKGATFSFLPQEQTSFDATIASPNDPWQDYADIDNAMYAARLKHKLLDNLSIGVTTTGRVGFNTEQNSELDAKNFVGGVDLGYEIINGIKTYLEVARSQSNYDLSTSEFESKLRGNAYYVGLMGRFPFFSVMNTEGDYFGIRRQEGEEFFTKARLFFSHMDGGFDPTLTSYAQTRDDELWSRHLHFKEPFKYYPQESDALTWDDVKNFAIGNGIDKGRQTIGFRMENSLWEDRITNLFDIRNVNETGFHVTDEAGYVETVAREEVTAKITDKLTGKFLFINQDLPRTNAGVDPFIVDPVTGEHFLNAEIPDDEDPSVRTGSVGLEYQIFDWVAINGTYEYTNDYALGYENFPRGLLGSSSVTTYYDNYDLYREQLNFLYSQQYFPVPPYPYYNIFKTGLRLTPLEKLEIYLDYTRNEYSRAGQISDDMNHVGIEIAYSPFEKIDLYFKYTYSRWQDLDRLLSGLTDPVGHNNFFAEIYYHRSVNEDLVFQYGESYRNPYKGDTMTIGWDPYGGSLSVLDTQHIVRLYYRRKF